MRIGKVGYLTKSRFQTAVECPRKLYYTGKRGEYRDAKEADSFLKSLADGGFQVGELAKCLFPEGIEIKTKATAAALAKTARELAKDNVTLFEPAISHGHLLVRVDILVKNGHHIKLIEVKAKSIRSNGLHTELQGRNGLKPAFRPYLEDIAFQVHVVGLAYPDCRVTGHLMMPDKSRVASWDRMNQLFKIKRLGNQSIVEPDERAKSITAQEALLYEFPVGQYIAQIHRAGLTFPGGTGSLADMAQQWADAYAADRALPPTIGAHCASCEFKAEPGSALKSGFHECWKEAAGLTDADLAKPTVLELWNFRGKQKLIEAGKLFLADVGKDELGDYTTNLGVSTAKRQWLQVQWEADADSLPLEFQSAGFHLDHNYMAIEMDRWRYPLHFIDFETSTTALPFHAGMKPYENVAFQFSHHVMERDGTLRHANQFLLAEPGVFPNYEFARALKAALSNDDGSVFMWANHENTILGHIVEQLKNREDAPADKEELASFLQTLVKSGKRAMIDLRIMAQKGYFHPSTRGSNSLKKVLPAVLQSSRYLRERYSQPIYGTKNGIPSLNFSSMTWWIQDGYGSVADPYKLLLTMKSERQLAIGADPDDLDIAAGGEASMAYGRLQFETLNEAERNALKAKLLRYCELDTLAMAMVVEAWQDTVRGR